MIRSRIGVALLAVLACGCFNTRPRLVRGSDLVLPPPSPWNMLPAPTVGCNKVPMPEGPLAVRETGTPPSAANPTTCLAADSLRRTTSGGAVKPIAVP